MARIGYDDQTAAAFKAVREVLRDGLGEWREAVRRHLRPSPEMTLADIGAGNRNQSLWSVKFTDSPAAPMLPWRKFEIVPPPSASNAAAVAIF